jgi:pimeloyl-ACP methyl ester carboxylesterase
MRMTACEDIHPMSDSSLDHPLIHTDGYGGGDDAAWRGVDWREHQRWIELPEGPVNTITMGDGPPMVFIHGLGGSWTNWLEQLPAFAEDFRVVTMDLPGFGASPLPASGELSIPAYADVVAAVLAELEIDSATIVGNSMGGFIAAELTLRHPALVERLVLISAAGISSERFDVKPFAVGFRMTAGAAAWIGTRSDVLTRRPRARRALVSGIVRHPELLAGPMIAEMVRGSGKPGFVDALTSLTGYAIKDRLADIRCPTLIVWGENDRIVPPRDAPQFEQAIADSRLVRYADTGHMPQVERPAHFNGLLRDFVAETSESVREENAAASR